LWASSQQDPLSSAYNLAVRFRFVGKLNLPTLERAFNDLIQRHETLRTTFAVVDNEPVQVVSPSLTVQVPVIDLRSLAESERTARADQLAGSEARRPFDLAKGPLIRATLLCIKDEEHILLISVHQITCDCWSTGLLSKELGPLYDAACQGIPSNLPALPIQYGDFAVWQKQWLAECDLGDQLAYWTRQLADLPPLEVPTDKPRPAKKTANSHIESVLLPKPLTDALKDLSHREGCTFFMLSLATLKILIQRHARQNDVYVGTITAGRSRVELEPLIGRFINSLIVRTHLDGDPSFLQHLAQVRTRVLEALDHRDLPYELVLEALAPKPDPSRHPLFQINFVHQRAFMKPLETAGISLTPIPSKAAGAIYDLYFFMVERAEGWRFSCEYNTDLYEIGTIQRMLTEYQGILESVAADPSQRISQLGTTASHIPRANTQAQFEIHNKPSFEDPRDHLEARVARVWEQVLGGRKLSVTADFFDEGGHSVLAARLLANIEQEFGKKLPFATLLRAPTIRGLAARLRSDGIDARQEQVHEIQPEGSRTPFFVVTSQPPLYRPLSRLLGDEQPTLGLTVPEFRALPEAFTIHDVAANLLEAMREVQPAGPYYLGGWCVSGIIVYEMAQQLRAQNETVPLLAIFDAQSPPYARELKALRATFPTNLYFRTEKLVHWCRKAVQSHPKETAAYAWQRIRGWEAACRRRVGKLVHPNRPEPPPDDLTRLVHRLHDAVLAYEPKPYDSPVVLFRSRVLQSGRYRDPLLGWGDYARAGLDVVETPGEHGDMFKDPTVAMLAEKLAQYLPKSAALTNEPVDPATHIRG
jgi:thioesterase domain-containing protein